MKVFETVSQIKLTKKNPQTTKTKNNHTETKMKKTKETKVLYPILF